MKTLTIKQDIIDSLGSDESKLEFANSVIALLSDSEDPQQSSQNGEALSQGLNSDLPEPMKGAPDFDSGNMDAPEFRRYSLLMAGYVPAGKNGLNCSYSDYEYRQLSDMTEHEIESLWNMAAAKIKQSRGKRDYVKFLNYLCDIYYWYFTKKIHQL